jgi:hypothetical protein
MGAISEKTTRNRGEVGKDGRVEDEERKRRRRQGKEGGGGRVWGRTREMRHKQTTRATKKSQCESTYY